MRNYPSCPKCEDILYRRVLAQDVENDTLVAEFFCYECGWSSGFISATTLDELDAKIAEIVAAQAQAQHD